MSKKKRVSIIGTAGIPSSYGGFETVAENLVERLNSRISFVVYCSRYASGMKNKRADKVPYPDTRLVFLPLKANGIFSILYDIVSIFHAVFASDVLLILGVSGCLILPLIRIISRKRIIVNVDGMEWKRSKWSTPAKWFLYLSWLSAIRFSSIIISDNRCIRDYINQEFGKKSKLIEYGGDIIAGRKTALSEEDFPFINKTYALSICRIEPENNIEMILEAFLSEKDLNIAVIGNWDSSSYSQKLREKYSSSGNIYLTDAIYDRSILCEIRKRSSLYIHGHSAGGTNPSLVEIMFYDVPVIAFDVCYNRETTENKAFYFNDRDSLILLLREFTGQKIKKPGHRLAEIAERRYKWDLISEKYYKLFI